jgi:hypothetical protein
MAVALWWYAVGTGWPSHHLFLTASWLWRPMHTARQRHGGGGGGGRKNMRYCRHSERKVTLLYLCVCYVKGFLSFLRSTTMTLYYDSIRFYIPLLQWWQHSFLSRRACSVFCAVIFFFAFFFIIMRFINSHNSRFVILLVILLWWTYVSLHLQQPKLYMYRDLCAFNYFVLTHLG